MANTSDSGVARSRPRRVNKHGEEVQEFLVRLEQPLYDALAERADRDRMSKVEVIRTALRRYL